MAKKYKAAVVHEAGRKFVIEERDIPTPGSGEVLIKVAACGMCHSDKFPVNGWMPGMSFPIVPGHEVVGTVVDVGKDVEWPTKGMLVGVGWHGKHCLFCESCRRGDFMMCPKSHEAVTGIHSDGGYAEYMIAHWTGIAQLPDNIDPVAAAPLLCAGITVFNSIRHQDNLSVGDIVAIQGIGGLGHLGIQFAKKMGYRVVAISSSDAKQALAEQLGCDHYINASEESNPPSQQLQALGGAKVIVATAPDAKSMSDLVNGLGPNGRLLVVGADMQNLEFSPFQVIRNRAQVCGWSSGTPIDSSDTCTFAFDQNIQSMNEVYPLEKVQEAYDHMINGKARFCVVLKMG